MRYILIILLLIPIVSFSQVLNRNKSIRNIGTTGIGQYSGNTSQRPTGDFRWLRWNTDSGRVEVKINSTTWRGFLFNGEAAAGGGGGITTLNTLTASTQTFATGTSGTDFGISSTTSTHTFNIPTASASNRGLLSTTDWSTFNGKLTASDTVGRFWSLAGNSLGATKFFGSRDNENITFISNNLIRGGLSAGGEWRLGNNNDNGTYTVQLNGRTSIFGTAGNSFVVEDDGANNSNATSVLNISSNGLLNTIFTTPSGANTISFRDYGTTTDLLTIGADNNVGITHLLTDAATSGNKYAYSAQNTFNPTSGTATRWAYEDATTINQTGGANGIYASFYAHPTLTAAADARAFWNTVGNNKLNTTSGVTMIATSTDDGSGAKLQINGNATVADEAYDATSWNGNNGVPTKNAIRDKIESMGGGGYSFLNKQYTTTQNSGTSTTDMYTYTIPGNTLTTDGDIIDIETSGFLLDATTTPELTMQFNGANLVGTGVITIPGTIHWSITGRIIRTSSSTARATVTINLADGNGKQFIGNSTYGSVDFTSGLVVRLLGTATGAGASTGDILGHTWTVEFKR